MVSAKALIKEQEKKFTGGECLSTVWHRGEEKTDFYD